jgi:hypothetical protein
VVRSKSTCDLAKYVGMSALSDNSSLMFLASFRIKFRENNFVVFFYVLFFSNVIFQLTAVITARKYRKDKRRSSFLPQ